MPSASSSPPTTEKEPGHLLHELERRQDQVLEQLDELDAKLTEVLQGLGVTISSEIDSA